MSNLRVRRVGFRTISCAACADPILISKIDEVKEAVRARVDNNFKDYGFSDYFLDFQDLWPYWVMSMFSGIEGEAGQELLIVLKRRSVLPKQKQTLFVALHSITFLHYGYDGRMSTAGKSCVPIQPI